MNSHSEKQSVILKTMGVEVWKLRHLPNPAEAPELSGQSSPTPPFCDNLVEQLDAAQAGQPAATSKVEAVAVHNETTAVNEKVSDLKNQEAVKHNHNSIAPAIQSERSAAAKFDISDNVAAEIVDWRASVSRQTGAKWCFVCALSDNHVAAENKLFEAIKFALGLSESDCHVIEATATAETFSESDAERGVKNSLSALIEEERPSNIVLLGEELAQFLIETDKPLDVLRSESYRYQGGTSCLYVTYSLEHLLTHPLDKLSAWQDLVKARKTIN